MANQQIVGCCDECCGNVVQWVRVQDGAVLDSCYCWEQLAERAWPRIWERFVGCSYPAGSHFA